LATWLPAKQGPAAIDYFGGQLAIAAPAEADAPAEVGDSDDAPVVEAVVVDPAKLTPADRDALETWLAGPHPKIVHDAKSAMHALWAHDLELAGVSHDTFLASYLLRPSQRSYTLENVLQRHLNRTLSRSEGQMTLLDEDSGDTERAGAILDLAAALAAELDDNGLYDVYADIEIPLAPALARMEKAGIAVDV